MLIALQRICFKYDSDDRASTSYCHWLWQGISFGLFSVLVDLPGPRLLFLMLVALSSLIVLLLCWPIRTPDFISYAKRQGRGSSRHCRRWPGQLSPIYLVLTSYQIYQGYWHEQNTFFAVGLLDWYIIPAACLGQRSVHYLGIKFWHIGCYLAWMSNLGPVVRV